MPKKAPSKVKAAAKASPRKGPARPSKVAKKVAIAGTMSDGDWRQATLEHMRELILEADPEMIEERKWIKPTKPAGVPVWSHAGIVCTGEIYQKVVKLTFMNGASVPDPKHLFNASLEGGTRRAIDIAEGESVDPRAFKALIKAAVALNSSKKKS